MRPLQTYIILIITGVILAACGQKNSNQILTADIQDSAWSGKLIQIDFSDTNYFDLRIWIKDTITPDGWTIKYLVKDDSTKYNDLYIECSKDKIKGTFYGSDLLQMRRYFIPIFAGETKTHLYLTHACATDCSAVLTFSKDSTRQFKDYHRVIDYNINFGQILYVTDSCYVNEDKIYDLALIDLSKNKLHRITFNNICSAVYKPACIDTVIFSESKVVIKTTLRESFKTEKEIKQTKIIDL